MLDIRFVRENPDAVKENIRKKFQDEKLPMVDEAIALDAEIRRLKGSTDGLRANRNKLSKEIGNILAKRHGKQVSDDIDNTVIAIRKKVSDQAAQLAMHGIETAPAEESPGEA